MSVEVEGLPTEAANLAELLTSPAHIARRRAAGVTLIGVALKRGVAGVLEFASESMAELSCACIDIYDRRLYERVLCWAVDSGEIKKTVAIYPHTPQTHNARALAEMPDTERVAVTNRQLGKQFITIFLDNRRTNERLAIATYQVRSRKQAAKVALDHGAAALNF